MSYVQYQIQSWKFLFKARLPLGESVGEERFWPTQSLWPMEREVGSKVCILIVIPDTSRVAMYCY